MDWDAASWGITRDIEAVAAAGPGGWVVLLLVFALPLVSLFAVWKGRTLAWVPLAISVGLGVQWVLYYATDWWSNPGMTGAVVPLFLVVVAWLLLLIALGRLRRRNGAARPG